MMDRCFIKRFVSLDFLKVFAAIVTFLFHCNIHLGVHFLWLTPFISQGTIVMDLFFMLSGFILCQVYREKTLQGKGLLSFYSKRIVAIYPLYVLVMAVFFARPAWRGSVVQTLVTLPVELGLLQSWISGMSGYGHNRGHGFFPVSPFST